MFADACTPLTWPTVRPWPVDAPAGATAATASARPAAPVTARLVGRMSRLLRTSGTPYLDGLPGYARDPPVTEFRRDRRAHRLRRRRQPLRPRAGPRDACR